MHRSFQLSKALSNSLRITLFFFLSVSSQLRAQDSLATVNFYRPGKSTGSFGSYDIKLGDVVIGRVKPSSVVAFRTKPGSQMFSAAMESESSFRLITEAGKTYFVECGIGEGAAAGRPTFRLASMAQAEKEIANIKSTEGQDLYSQRRIKLTNTKSKKVLILERGMRVAYVLHGALTAKTGILQGINKTTFVVDEATVSYADLSAIGRRRSGSGFFQFFCGFAGGSTIVSALIPPPTPQCQGCQVQSSTDSGAVVAGVIIGVGLIGVGINSGYRNSPKSLLSAWKLDVIE